jgi:hypothetical protein
MQLDGGVLHQCPLLEDSKSDVGFPINVFGTVIARDELDYKCVHLFKRESDDPQFITSPVSIYFSTTLIIIYSFLPIHF